MATATDYDLLAIFAAVAELTSFSKAAKKLGLSKGSVSRAIVSLESLVGAELIHRTTHKVALSTAGAQLYERATPHLSALAQTLKDFPERADEPSGELRLTAPLDVAHVILPEILVQFSKRYPKIRVDLRVSNKAIDLVSEGFDVAIRVAVERMKDSGLTARRLIDFGGKWYAAPSYLAARGTPRAFGEAKHDWVLFSSMLPRLSLGKSGLPENVRIVCDDFVLIRELVRDGMGVGVLPRFVAEPYVREGRLEPLAIADPSPIKAHLFLVYPSSGQVPRKVKAFRDFVVEVLRKRGPLG